MNIDGIVLVTVIAVTVEALVEYGRTAITSWNTARRTVVLQMAAIMVSTCLCLLVGADIYRALGITFAWQPVGCVLTGIFSARGANFISDLVGRLRNLLK